MHNQWYLFIKSRWHRWLADEIKCFYFQSIKIQSESTWISNVINVNDKITSINSCSVGWIKMSNKIRIQTLFTRSYILFYRKRMRDLNMTDPALNINTWTLLELLPVHRCQSHLHSSIATTCAFPTDVFFWALSEGKGLAVLNVKSLFIVRIIFSQKNFF